MTRPKKKEKFVPVPVPVPAPAPKKPAPKKTTPAPAAPVNAPAVPVNALPVPGSTPTLASGFAPFTPTPAPNAGSGAADPNQPFGQGFGSDYGLDPTHDPNFAFGSGAASPGQTAQTGSSSGLGNGYARTADGTLIYTDPNGIQYQVDNGVFAQISGYHQGTYNGLPPGNSALYPGAVGYVPPGTPQNQVPGYFQADAAGQYISGDYNAYTAYAQGRGVTPAPGPGSTPTVPSISSQVIAPGVGPNTPSFPSAWGGFNDLNGQQPTGSAPGSGGASGGGGGGGAGGSASGGGSGVGSGGTQAQQDAQASIQQVLNSYGLGGLASWAWGEIVGGKSQDQVILDLMQTPDFKNRFPAIAARQQAGLPAISPADIVNYEGQATKLMRAAGLPSGFWDSPSDFTHLIASDVSINELTQRLNLASQAAYQVPADVRATLARDYGVGPGQLAAFFLDDKTALPLIQRDFTAAQIGGAAYRTGYGSTEGEDQQLTDLGVTPGQAQQGLTQLTMQRQLMSSLPGENTTGISRDQQLAATFGGNALDQEEIVRRSQQRAAVFSQGGQFGQTSTGIGIGAAQGA